MNSPFTFETEEFEIADEAATEQTCQCAKCQAEREQEYSEDDETLGNFSFEDEFLGEDPLLQESEPPAAPARYAAAPAWVPLTTEKICWAQNVLNRARGGRLTVDGKAGPLFRAAVKRFQSAQRLKVDGIVGLPTETALIQAALNEIAKQSRVPIDGVMDVRTVQAIRGFQSAQRLTVDGRVGAITRGAMIRALGGRTCSPPPLSKPTPGRGGAPASPSPTDGRKYTNNPNEVVTTRTTPTPREVVDMLRIAWPELTENGARTLTAQFMGETGGGRYCFNWNLGNVKEPTGKLPHMYLRNVWEVITPVAAEAQVNRASGFARIASDIEVRKNGWSRPAGMAVVVFSPPHPACRFRAYANLRDGAQRWLDHHQRIARQNSGYLNAVNAGDTRGVAHALKMARYYTAGEADYARLMARKKAEIDRALGAI